ncbi:MAG: hypothetical protein QF511_01565 [Rhodospirillales bacterium]|nr:hypothetical protein [Rhodospirillales bacterium]
MISLKQKTEPYDIELPYGITVTVKPLTTASMAAAQSAARRRVEAVESQARDRKESGLPLDGLPDLDDEEERDGFLQCQVVYELAARHVTAWTGIEDDPPVTRENIIAVMDLYPVGEQFLQKLTLQQMLLNAAKNGSGLSASGISSQAEGPDTAKDAGKKARPARKAR